ncbi:uncharacterized protein LOC122663105 [Telopea speciosissima]|uniref:uncharacterized protein LOC122663105 n=1 Tax=Telopea speciosissima TaxID=54955 RepID=UPI001CC50D30|nr:uncharacterized protein LOC122663105 [Telopea speciosissima]
MASSDVTVDELTWFHGIDRKIFTILVINLRRDIAESIRVVGLWLWLEAMGYPNIILSLLSSTEPFIELVVNEAILCLNTIDNKEYSPSSTEIPYMKKLMNRDISLLFIHGQRVSAITKILQFVSDIAPKIFDDILKKAVRHQSRVMGSDGSDQSSDSHPDVRTIFITFARGYPISESELKDFFNMNYGECVESIYMQPVVPHSEAKAAVVSAMVSELEHWKDVDVEFFESRKAFGSKAAKRDSRV